MILLNMDQLASRKPEHIFILIGSNDIKISDKKEFMAKYAQLIAGIKEKLPNSKINILSITPVSVDALNKEPSYKRIPEYNLSLQELARTENVNYIDLMPIFKNNAIPYASDGIRFKTDFYPLFLNHVRKTSIDVFSQKTDRI
ncbi:GDSL-type esterase/lipase family protein [Paenibacillus sp. DMB20]|uniref:GDSL-type esterase/lipase family protein n=1 Tax=Paenibacillus sp. DMB20 TaxID=1642570 RepID=UPI00069CBABE|nr:GDSL-type esterase/lipase family protein [Paenibacillus sp. DMB20]